jgi:hypothetical protein
MRIVMSSLLRAFDGVFVDPVFQKNDHGETIFYPFGLLGQGYLAPEDRLAGLRQAARGLWIFTLVATISLVPLSRKMDIPGAVGWLIYACAFALLIGVIVHLQARLAAGLKPTQSPRPSAGLRLRRARAARPPWSHWVLFLIGAFNLLLAGTGLTLGISDSDLVTIALAALWLLVGAALTLDGVLGLIEQSKAAKAH